MYPYGISHPPRERTGDWKTRICVVMLAGGWLALTATAAVSAQEAVDKDKAAAEAEHKDAAEAGANERERKQSTDAEELAAIERDAAIVTIKPESPQVRQVCRKISVTGTRFTRRECRTAEQWEEVNARQSADARRLVRDVQRQSSRIPALGPGEDTPQGRPSGLPNPAGL